MEKELKQIWTKELCQIEALKYDNRTDFLDYSRKAYDISRENRWMDEICSHMIRIPKWNKELCQIEANKYKGRKEFQDLSKNAYLYAHKNGWIDEICSHMIPNRKYSMPQLMLKDILSQLINEKLIYNDRKTIKPKELDIYFPDYKLAFEYNGKRWHDLEIIIKRDINKLEICNKLGIFIITINDCGLRYAKYEEKIKTQLIDNLTIINDLTKLNISKEDVLNISISKSAFNDTFDYNDVREICNKYTIYSEFRKNENPIYQILLKYKKINEFTSHMKRGRNPNSKNKGIKLNIDGINYASIAEAGRILNIKNLTVRWRLYSKNFPNYKFNI